MNDRDAQALGLLLLLSRASSASSSTTRAPSSARRGVPRLPDWYTEPSESELTSPPETPSEDDLLWAQYAGDTKREGALLQAEDLQPAKPVQRKLTRFERWALAPYFAVSEDLDAPLYIGSMSPDYNRRVRESMRSPSLTDEEIRAIALRYKTVAVTRPDGISFPDVRPLWSRWWLGALAHELHHWGQYRLGMTVEQAKDAWHKHGYDNSPIEVQAKETQRRVLRGLTARARAFYRSKNP